MTFHARTGHKRHKATVGRHARPLPPGTSPARWWLLVFLSIGVSVVIAEPFALSVMLPSMVIDEGIDPFHMIGASLLSATVAAVWAGAAADRLGRRSVTVLAAAVVGLSSVLASRSESESWLLAARFFHGAGSSTLLACVWAIVSSEFRDRNERRIATSVMVACAGAAISVAAVFAGRMSSAHSWRWFFWAQAAAAAVVVFGIAYNLVETRPNKGPWDPVGLAMCALSAVGFGTTASLVAYQYLPAAIIAGSVTCVAAYGFIRWEDAHRSPLISQRLFGATRFWTSAMTIFLASMASTTVLVVSIQYLMTVGERSPARTGTMLAWFAVPAAVAALRSTFFLDERSYRVTISIGLALIGASCIWLAGIEPGSRNGMVAGALLLLGTGWGRAVTAATEKLLASAPHRIAPTIGSVAATATQVGVSVGVSLGLVMASTKFSTRLIDLLPGAPASVTDLAARSVGYAWAYSVISDQLSPGLGGLLRSKAEIAFTGAAPGVLWLAAAFVAWGVVAVVRWMPALGKPRREKLPANDKSVAGITQPAPNPTALGVTDFELGRIDLANISDPTSGNPTRTTHRA